MFWVKGIVKFVLLVQYLFRCSKQETNIALNKPAKASSYYPGSTAGRVVDGNSDSHWFTANSCWGTIASAYLDPWWQVDLETEVFIRRVIVTTRSDCCAGRLHDFAIDLYTSDPSTNPGATPRRCNYYDGAMAAPDYTVSIDCARPVQGRFLRISGKKTQNSQDLLTICEVVVHEDKTGIWELCHSFTQHQHHRLDTQEVENKNTSSSTECASLCEADMSCAGFNVNIEQDITCQLVQNPDVAIGGPLPDLSWNSYLLNPCSSHCGN